MNVEPVNKEKVKHEIESRGEAIIWDDEYGTRKITLNLEDFSKIVLGWKT